MSLIDIAFVGVLFWMIFYQWPSMVLDATRQKLFTLRDQLFDESIADDPAARPAYRLIRDEINSLIRLTHVYTAVQVLIILCIKEPVSASTQRSVEVQLASLEIRPELREKLMRQRRAAFVIVAVHVIQRSLFLSLTFGIATRISIGIKPWFENKVSTAAAIEAQCA